MTYSDAWEEFRRRVDLDEYATRWDRLEAMGNDVHGEAEFVMRWGAPTGEPTRVLDAGCGAGRVARELARRGVDTTGIDLDIDLLTRAATRTSDVTWVHADLADLDLPERFDCVVLAGNVLPYVEPARQSDALGACVRHLDASGRLIMGMNLQPGWPTLDDIGRWMTTHALVDVARFAGWSEEPWVAGSRADYVVVVAERETENIQSSNRQFKSTDEA